MKHIAFLGLILSLAASTAPVLAQSAPPTPNPAMRAQFEQMRTQMRQIRTTERSQMLNALTPEHRSLLASLAGQLATSITPDYRGAASRLDAALSSGEKQAVLNAAQRARTSMRSLMETMHSQFEANEGGREKPEHPMNPQRRTPDAGMLLLHLASGGPEHGMMGGGMHP